MGNKLSKYDSTSKKNQIKFETVSQNKFDENQCQECEERQLQIEFAYSQWNIDNSEYENINFICNNPQCKWFKK